MVSSSDLLLGNIDMETLRKISLADYLSLVRNSLIIEPNSVVKLKVNEVPLSANKDQCMLLISVLTDLCNQTKINPSE
jgi:hypothetical protein